MEILPDEILSRIFEHLPLTDRKRVRFTCRAWHDACIRSNIIKEEKFVFRSDARIADVARVMLRSNHSLLNLEFQNLPVYHVPASSWVECGERIHELAFYRCRVSDNTMKDIILRCVNLRSLVEVPTKLVDAGYSLRLLNDLIEKGIRRPNLRTLYVSIDEDEHEMTLCKIFLFHPYITSLKFRTISRVCRFPVSLNEPPILLRLDRCLKPNTRLESLTYNKVSKGNWLEPLTHEAEQGLRLKTLETNLIYERSTKDIILNFFKSQKHLEVIRLLVQNACVDGIEDLVCQILESCPKLRELRLETPGWWEPPCIHLKSSEMPRFVALIAKLKFLSLRFTVHHSEPAYTHHDALKNNALSNLISLNWNNADSNHFDSCNVFLQHCSSLQHLQLSWCRDTTLQTIFQYLPELRTFVLEHIALCTDSGFTGSNICGNEDNKGYSVRRLQKLKYFRLSGCNSNVTWKTMVELQFPNLQYMSLDKEFFRRLSEETWNHLASHLPALRVLTIERLFHSYEIMEGPIQFCRQLKNLDQLVLPGVPDTKFFHWDEDEFIRGIFRACTSLRYILYVLNRRTKAFWFDPIEKRPVLQENLIFPSGNIFEDNIFVLF